MKTILQILPLAITMMAGPQIISSIILITGKNAVKSSLAYIFSVMAAATTGTFVLYVIFELINLQSSGIKETSPLEKIIETSLIVILIILSIKTFLNRENIKQPKWMSTLQNMEPRDTIKLAFTLISFMPSDIVIMITVALHLSSRNLSFFDIAPFILITGVVAALPLITYGFFHKRAVKIMPKVQEWTDRNSWIIQIGVYLIFIFLLWK